MATKRVQAERRAAAAAIRNHWATIENGTHYRRDMTLGEDANRTADRNAPACAGHADRAAVLTSLRTPDP